jgi:hypothetical protein
MDRRHLLLLPSPGTATIAAGCDDHEANVVEMARCAIPVAPHRIPLQRKRRQFVPSQVVHPQSRRPHLQPPAHAVPFGIVIGQDVGLPATRARQRHLVREGYRNVRSVQRDAHGLKLAYSLFSSPYVLSKWPIMQTRFFEPDTPRGSG